MPLSLSLTGPFSRLVASAILSILLMTRNIRLTLKVQLLSLPYRALPVRVVVVFTRIVVPTSVLAPPWRTSCSRLLAVVSVLHPRLSLRLQITLRSFVLAFKVSVVCISITGEVGVPVIMPNVLANSILLVSTVADLLKVPR